MVEKDNSCQVHGSTLQSSMVIYKPQPSVLHPFGETSSFEVLMSFKLKTFCYITSTYLSQHFIPMHLNNHYVNSVQVHESNEIYFRLFYPCLTNQEHSRITHVHCYLDDNWCPQYQTSLRYIIFHTLVLPSVLKGSCFFLWMFSG